MGHEVSDPYDVWIDALSVRLNHALEWYPKLSSRFSGRVLDSLRGTSVYIVRSMSPARRL